ncbi:MAG: sulfotransferase, partial [Phycisphaerales bacterium]|nr:sulfotransferase [Phycisphaerales bacterium]
LAIRPGHPFASATLGRILIMRGEPQAAFDICAASRERKPAVAIVMAEACERLGRADEGLDLLRPSLAPSIPPIMRSQAWFMMGRLHERQGEYADAFAAWTEGNALSPETFDPDVHEAAVDRLLDAWSPEAIDRLPVGSSEASPIFIVGMPRSGTSLVEQILDAHPDVHACGELDDVLLFVNALQPGAPNRTPLLTETSRLTAPALDAFAAGYVSTHLEALHMTDKQPVNFLHLGVIRRAFPNARIVHCVRDPLDTCLSCFATNLGRLPPFTNVLDTLGRYYTDYRRVIEHFDRMMPIVHVEYEALVADQDAETRRLLDALGLGWNDACLRYHESERIVVTASNDQVRQPIYHSSIGRAARFGEALDPLREALERRS